MVVGNSLVVLEERIKYEKFASMMVTANPEKLMNLLLKLKSIEILFSGINKFQRNIIQSILVQGGFQFVQMGPFPSQEKS